MAKQSKTKPISAKWRKLLALLPGYDSIKAAAPGDWFDEEAAERPIEFCHECLHHIEGVYAGKPFDLESWEQAIVGALFGWKREDGTRRYRECFIMVGRGNGKTPLAGAVVLYMLFCDGEPGAQIYGAGSEAKQAGLLFRHAAGMVRAEPQLSKRAQIYEAAGNQTIALVGDPLSSYKAVSADAGSKHGYNPHLVVGDEVHAWADRKLMDAFETAFAKKSRRQPLLLNITTADFEREGSICNEKEDYAEKVAQGVIEDRAFLPVLFRAPKTAADDGSWKNETVWEAANPNIDVTVDRDALRRFCRKAQEQSTYLNEFLRLHLNIRTQQDVRWLPLDKWDACDGSVDERALEGRECFAGLDLSATMDLTAFVLLFPPENSGEAYQVLPFVWIPENTAQKHEHTDRVPYLTWERQGAIEFTSRDTIDYELIRLRINELGKRYHIMEIAADRWNALPIITQLDGDGFTIATFGQGFKDMTAPSKELEKLVMEGRIRHGGHPVLRWCASNVSVEIDAAGNIKPSKKKSTERIDPIVALIMALGRAMVRPERRSVYETRGVLTL